MGNTDLLRPVMQDPTAPVAVGGGGASSSAPVATSDWILASGEWNDSGVWDDASDWMDGP